MKKPFLIALVICISFFSCKKDKHNTNTPAKEKHALNFDVSDFTHTVVPLANNPGKLRVEATSTSPATQLVYILFNASGNVFSQQTHYSTESNFGTVRDSVPDGNYTVIFAAGADNLQVRATSGLAQSYMRYIGDLLSWHDTFYKKINITVAGSVITQTVTLDRIVAQLEINIEDAIPTEVKAIRVVFADAPFIKLQDLGHDFSAWQDLRPTISSRAANFKIGTYTVHNNDPFQITITAMDFAGKIIYTKNIYDVKCVTNKKTILSGKLFTDPGNFTVTTGAEVTNPDINITF